jgi:fucose permease
VSSAMKEVLRRPDLYAAGILAFFHGLAQGAMVSFVGQLYQKRFAIDAAIATYFISLNSGRQFGGRFVLSWITSRWRIHELVVLSACATLAASAFVATILSPGYL